MVLRVLNADTGKPVLEALVEYECMVCRERQKKNNLKIVDNDEYVDGKMKNNSSGATFKFHLMLGLETISFVLIHNRIVFDDKKKNRIRFARIER